MMTLEIRRIGLVNELVSYLGTARAGKGRLGATEDITPRRIDEVKADILAVDMMIMRRVEHAQGSSDQAD